MTREPPEILVTCEACGGEGSTEQYESVSKWSIDPPSGFVVICERCQGAGCSIEEAEGAPAEPLHRSGEIVHPSLPTQPLPPHVPDNTQANVPQEPK